MWPDTTLPAGVRLIFFGDVMAGKAPAIQFYVKDWLSDPELRMASHSTKGIWIDMLCYMWESSERGKLCGTIEQIKKLVSASDEDMDLFLSEADTLRFCDVTICNKNVTVINRRIHQDYKDKQNTRLRVKRFREKQKGNADVTPSSPSPSPSPTTKIKNIARFDAKDFNKFYSEYPVHTGKTPALEKWKKKLKDGSLPGLNILIEAIGKQKEWRLNATDFRPAWKNPAAWLHQEAWTDELTEYGGNNGTGKQYDRKDKNWVDREADAETARLNARYRAIQASKAAPGDTG